MSNYFIGEVITRFYWGEKYQFKYVGNGEFEQVSGGIPPSHIRDEINNLK